MTEKSKTTSDLRAQEELKVSHTYSLPQKMCSNLHLFWRKRTEREMAFAAALIITAGMATYNYMNPPKFNR